MRTASRRLHRNPFRREAPRGIGGGVAARGRGGALLLHREALHVHDRDVQRGGGAGHALESACRDGNVNSW